MYTAKDVTFYIPCFNAEKTVFPCINAILHQSHMPAKVIVIDDGSRAQLKIDHDRVHVLRHPQNLGLATARNTALDACATPLLASVDSDVLIDSDWLEQALESLNVHEVSGVGGCLIEHFQETTGDQWRAIHMRQNWGDSEILNPRFLYGANTLYKTADLRTAGGYDARLRTNDEDRSLCDALASRNFSFLYSPHLNCRHLRQDTCRSVLRGYWRWHYSRGLLQGDFDSSDGLFNRLFVVNFGIFQYRLELDRRQRRRKFFPIDALIPWVFSALDLKFYSERQGIAGPNFLNPQLSSILPAGIADFIPRSNMEVDGPGDQDQGWYREYTRMFRSYLEEAKWFELCESIGSDWDSLRQELPEQAA